MLQALELQELALLLEEVEPHAKFRLDRLDRLEHLLSLVHEFWVGHYNFMMLRIRQILVRVVILAAGAVVLAACGQKGALFIPTEPAAAHRATLVQSLRPKFATPASAAASSPRPAASSPSAP